MKFFAAACLAVVWIPHSGDAIVPGSSSAALLQSQANVSNHDAPTLKAKPLFFKHDTHSESNPESEPETEYDPFVQKVDDKTEKIIVALSILVIGVVACFMCMPVESATLKRLKTQFDDECPEELKSYYESEDFYLKCNEVFDKADQNSNGSLNVEEIQEAMSSGALPLMCIKAETVVKAFDCDGDNTISKPEFIQLMKWACYLEGKTSDKDDWSSLTDSAFQFAKSNTEAKAKEILVNLEVKKLHTLSKEEAQEKTQEIMAKWNPENRDKDADMAEAVMHGLKSHPVSSEHISKPDN